MTVASLTRELVSIPSHTDEGETEAGEFIESWLRRETDADVERDAVGNVIARKGPTADGDTLALVGHHDVVEPDDTQLKADSSSHVEERNGRLYGRGTADMKGAVAAAMLAFRDSELNASDSSSSPQSGETDAPGELVFASFVGEEVGGTGARHAISEGFSPEYAIVGEGSTNYSGPDVTDVVVAHKGRRGSTITAHGSAAHASEIDAGENAIYRATDAVDRIRALEFPAADVAGEVLEGTIAVTEIGGGTAMNVIPDRCEVTVDERTVPGERADLGQVEELVGVEWMVDQDLPPMRCDDMSFAGTVQSVADDAQSGSPELVTKPHATDAGWLSEAGTECVIYGAAEPGEAHTDDESVSIEVLDRCYETYRGVAETWLQ
ncbi:peptidase M20 [Natrialba hulunbeirensis JCM 10989]|uniref:Peptidase M20 n=1 Tax=Natrialba hulunbeirensis JCM 10989 TaxID=1227493 RepID=M0A5G5_9EURY|nr:M20/M25/M40 family metallo-hydrolase [Natrialba hulunbeirensis]ELY92583.1 peptidase M20 [Natrialba hulunbeirensis JCM 10989]